MTPIAYIIPHFFLRLPQTIDNITHSHGSAKVLYRRRSQLMGNGKIISPPPL